MIKVTILTLSILAATSAFGADTTTVSSSTSTEVTSTTTPFSIGSTATGTSFGLVYDFDRAHGKAPRRQEERVFMKQETAIGAFDAGVLVDRLNSNNSRGYEVGYSNQLGYGGATLMGRVAYGRLNDVDVTGGGFRDHASFTSYEVEGKMPVATDLSAFVGYRHRKDNGDVNAFAQNRYTAGVDYAVDSSLSVRAGVATARQAGSQTVGLTTALNYAF
jgi:hypothetical protein